MTLHMTRPGGPAIVLLCNTPAIGRMIEADLSTIGGTLRRLDGAPGTLEALTAAPPDLVVAVVLNRDPALLCLCQSIGQREAFKATRLVMVQDSHREIDRRRSRALGADTLVALPLDHAGFRDTATHLLAEPA